MWRILFALINLSLQPVNRVKKDSDDDYEEVSVLFSEADLNVVELHDGQTEECLFIFSPTQVKNLASFHLP